MSSQKALITTRPYLPEDRNFVLSCWLRGLYYGNTFFSEIPKDIFMKHYHAVLEKFLTSPQVTITVACLIDDPQVILGYSVTRTVQDKKVLDWVFIKTAWRQIGIARSLVPPDVQVVTHLTKVGRAIKPAHVTYNPFT